MKCSFVKFLRIRFAKLISLGFIVIVIGLGSTSYGENLSGAITFAYHTNPSLLAQRSQLRITDETYVQARSGYRPEISIQANGGREDYAGVTSNTGSALIVANQPIYSGGRVAAAISAAEADILSGRENLRATEASVLQSVIQAYADVLRDQENVEIWEENLQALAGQFKEVTARATAGDLTRTDVAQSQGYVYQARVDLSSAKAQLALSQANYMVAVGRVPDHLDPIPNLPNMPSTMAQAQDMADAGNPNLRSALYLEQSARMHTAMAVAQKRPQVSLRIEYGYTGPVSLSAPHIYPLEASASAAVTQPLFTGGTLESQVRQAKEREISAQTQIEQARRIVAQQIIQNWTSYQAAKDNVDDASMEVKADADAYAGAQKERQIDLRSTFDVLFIEQSLRQAQLLRSSARHDSVTAAASLLQTMGLLEAALLVPNLEPYDPVTTFRHVKTKGSVPWETVPAGLDNLSVPRLNRLDAPAGPLPAG